MDACAYGELAQPTYTIYSPLCLQWALWEETICHPVVRDSNLGLVASSYEEPTTPSPTVCPSFQDQSRKVLEPLGRDRKERTATKGILKM